MCVCVCVCVCGVCLYAPHVVTRGAEICIIVYHVSFAGLIKGISASDSGFAQRCLRVYHVEQDCLNVCAHVYSQCELLNVMFSVFLCFFVKVNPDPMTLDQLTSRICSPPLSLHSV